jgi:branched-chain amino acid transport system permease protein
VLAVQLIVNGLLLGGTYVLVAQSLNLIFGVMGVVNLAHGSFIVMAGLFTAWLTAHAGVSPLLAVPVVFAATFILGAVLQPLLLEPLMKFGRRAELLSLMITFGLNYVLVNLSLQVWGSNYVSIPYLQGTWTIHGVTIGQALLVAGIAGGLLAALLHLGLNKTPFGKSLLAASQSTTGAICCGIDVGRMRLAAFALGVGLASAAGALLVLVIPLAAESADNLTILAFVIIALGGLGSYKGVAIAAVLLGLAQSAAGFFIGGDAENVLPYILLIAFMAARPQRFLRPAR